MKRLIAEKAWYEEFDSKRVIVREGHVPMGFYFILSGSALVSGMDEDKQLAQTILVLKRGDSFGELAMVNRARRQASVISKEPVELLVLSNYDFREIFMAGGMKDPNEQFLRKIPCFKGWPIERLGDTEGSKNVMFSYFKRGTVLVKDSLKNDWVFIIKSMVGIECQLHYFHIKHQIKIYTQIGMKDDLEIETKTGISHEEKIRVAYDDKNIQLHQQQHHKQQQRVDLKPLTEGKQDDERFVEQSNRVEEGNDRVLQISQGSSRKSHDSKIRIEASGRLSNIGNLLQKRPYLSSNSSHPSAIEIHGSDSRNGDHLQPIDIKKGTPELSHLSNPSPIKRVITPPDIPIFVNIQNLNRGDVFGISDLFFEDQPRLILVSRGVECIMVHKKFYKQHASHGFLTKLREMMFPYPSEEDLQYNLEQRFCWNELKKDEVYDVISGVHVRKNLKEQSRFPLPKVQTY
ncbi:hypothetical protein LOTGIDRAFT_158359 [Lottia gigantea]|uniref:Cyclic nucleotide-binding domain-containing protein n=1 Tax=Lottia gigantea TaxID=225164 RepID=V4APY7_LOTGI|nr:hypothetical protein LOTGIDRAFT_158359 [Lottia gigantea]ESO99282.1 hypothetical protein LOTGIDRAFT_158359 [Lottia gigantea]